MTNTNRTTLIRTCNDGDLVLRTAAGRHVTMSPGALETAQAVNTSVDLDQDIDHVIAQLTALPIRDEESVAQVVAAFEAVCLENADADDEQLMAAWREYATAITDFAQGPDDREPA